MSKMTYRNLTWLRLNFQLNLEFLPTHVYALIACFDQQTRNFIVRAKYLTSIFVMGRSKSKYEKIAQHYIFFTNKISKKVFLEPEYLQSQFIMQMPVNFLQFV